MLTVLMPCLDEAETLEVCIRKAQSAIDTLGVAGEVLIADNGSTDGSQEIARRCGARVVDVPTRGYGAALQAGIVAACSEYIVMGDADDSYDFANLAPYLDRLREGADLVMGDRFAGGIAPGAMPPLHRYFGNPVLSFAGRLLFRSSIRDFHCGLRGFRRDAILGLDLRTTGMEYASEMVVRAELAKLDVREVPTTLQPDGRTRAPHLRSWRDGWRHLRFLLLYSPRWLFLYPGLILILLGLAALAVLLPGKVDVGGVGFDAQSLMYAGGAIVVGFQAVLFGVLTKVFAVTQGLLPADDRVEKLFQRVRLETGLIAGALLLVAGIAGTVAGFAYWRSNDFGAIDFASSMRVLVPSLVALMIGTEVVLASFFLSVLGLPKR